jgi:hypothetical protein
MHCDNKLKQITKWEIGCKKRCRKCIQVYTNFFKNITIIRLAGVELFRADFKETGGQA